MIYKILLFVGVCFTITAHLLLKNSMRNINIGLDQGVFLLIKTIIKNPFLWVSAFLYGIGFLIYSVVLTKIDLSKAYPVSSILSISAIYLLAIFFLGEEFTMIKLVGCLFSVISIYLLLL